MHRLLCSRNLRFGSLALTCGLVLTHYLAPPWLGTNHDNESSLPVTKRKTELTLEECYEAFVAGQMHLLEEKLAHLQREMPEDNSHWNYGNVLHQTMIINGLLALGRDDDLERAKGFLVLAGQTPGSPQLGSYGPNMLLAKVLLDRGEYEAVECYIDQCGLFWDSGKEELATWRSQVRVRQIPDFGANLFY
ncbi:MAG: hypothetical protein IT423_18305 [Pirellulaceae bacterium]|nr:hypothetical protein [Pirellulaceae bacterium]